MWTAGEQVWIPTRHPGKTAQYFIDFPHFFVTRQRIGFKGITSSALQPKSRSSLRLPCRWDRSLTGLRWGELASLESSRYDPLLCFLFTSCLDLIRRPDMEQKVVLSLWCLGFGAGNKCDGTGRGSASLYSPADWLNMCKLVISSWG